MKKALFVLIIIGAGITAYGYLGFRTTEFIPEVSTVPLNRGAVVDTVGATGALEAVTTVQVGSQVSGIIEELNADYNSIVREGDVIARLEPSLFETQIEQARANLARSEADVERLAVTLEDALASAYQNSPILEARRAEVRAIDERMAQAVSGWRPTIGAEASYQERHQDMGIGGANSPINPDVQYNPFRWGATFDQTIYRGGQTVAEMHQAKSEVYEGRANLRTTEQDVRQESYVAVR